MHAYTQRGSAYSLELQRNFKVHMLKQLEKKPWIADHSAFHLFPYGTMLNHDHTSHAGVLCLLSTTYSWAGLPGGIVCG